MVKSEVREMQTRRSGWFARKALAALTARNVLSWSASSPSCDGEDQMLAYRAQLGKDTGLGVMRGQVGKMERVRKNQPCSLRSQVRMQSRVRIAKLEVEDEADSRKKLEMRS